VSKIYFVKSTYTRLTHSVQPLQWEHTTTNRHSGDSTMATFSEIVAQSEKDRHKVYFLGIPCTDNKTADGRPFKGVKLVGAGKPKKVNREKQLARLREAERKERAAKMAELYDGSEVELETLLPEPKHIKKADGGLPLMISLLRRVADSE
jgi:hypothetical protein